MVPTPSWNASEEPYQIVGCDSQNWAEMINKKFEKLKVPIIQ